MISVSCKRWQSCGFNFEDTHQLSDHTWNMMREGRYDDVRTRWVHIMPIRVNRTHSVSQNETSNTFRFKFNLTHSPFHPSSFLSDLFPSLSSIAYQSPFHLAVLIPLLHPWALYQQLLTSSNSCNSQIFRFPISIPPKTLLRLLRRWAIYHEPRDVRYNKITTRPSGTSSTR